ncbi:MAG: ADP-forming succinate--CoA ligase subunit beta [Proteobacteria bacterium]|nr:ADP-forming succinate--CoA ligase subunit beta [Pseudomonadota bacterium]
MNIHEYQAKELLKDYNLPVGKGVVVHSINEAKEKGADFLKNGVAVVKAQIHAGGRGKAGGVVICKTVEDIQKTAEKLFDKPLITHQTGPNGQVVKKLYIEDGASIKQEFYLSFVLDRSMSCLTIIASPDGGVDIEEVASNHPDRVIKVPIHPATGILPYHVRRVSFILSLTPSQSKQMADILNKFYQLFLQKDATLIEINPLIVNGDDDLYLLDAKISFDDNALFRHPDIEKLRDLLEEDAFETKARADDLNYIKLDGKVGCLVNGAGLAMATMDIIQLYGEKPANFLDVGGGATKEKVKTAFGIILSDPDVKGILVNIFGGIMRCDIIAEGIVAAVLEMNLTVPLVVRLQGTNMEKGQEILNSSGLKISSLSNLDDAAKAIVQQIRQ